jgi:GcrA cell cycle regulator
MSANGATWTSQRIELLKRCLHAGLSCRQIAHEIGVTRNAVIGKVNRLGLSQPKDVIGRQLEQRRAANLARPKTLWTRGNAVRAQPDEMSMADQQPGRRGLLLLRERASQRTTLLPGARTHCISAAPQRGCVSDMLRRRPITGMAGRYATPRERPSRRCVRPNRACSSAG